ncbi:hypothetical protein BX661DRAFT_193524 [Kickxella alabastrina]|uniref:uncharacterized protein n=1 Tax=Kickxella alabastrina TaxID=61397 RepID=UPI00221EBF3A|nr:uncharacterized protein BX661DRAFT_193524 [Kickxella alabastrina]KAI7830964.1 hypothetical protein BX661DRAFT_193524 [Kickxella alabastrina]
MSYGYRGGPPPQQQQGGYGGQQQQQQQQQQQRPGAQPPNTDQLQYWFRAVDSDASGQLDAGELQRALVNGDWSQFSMDTVRLMIGMFDRDRSGTISFQEFIGLWSYINDWKECFRAFDRDNSGTIDRAELLQALNAFGFRVSPQVVDSLVRKYDIQGANAGRGAITFDNFINACVTIRSLTDTFRRHDTDQDGWVNMSYDTFLQLVISNK